MKKGIKKYQAGVAGAGASGAGAAGAAGGAGGSGLSSLMGGMGGFDIGGMASQLGGSIAMLINANKKDKNPGRPYKKGSKLIKYQEGVEDATLSPGLASTYAEAQAMKANVEDRRKAFLRKISNREENTFDGKIDIALDPEVNAKIQKQFDIVRSSTGLTSNAKPSFNEVPVKKIKKADYFTAEAKGGYARALKEGKRDKQGNLIDSKTGLIYKDLRKSSSVPKSNTPLIRTKNVEAPRATMTGNEMVLMNKMGKSVNPFLPIIPKIEKPKNKEVVKNTNTSNVKRDTTMGPLIPQRKEVVVEAKRNPISALRLGPMIFNTDKNRETRMPKATIGVGRNR